MALPQTCHGFYAHALDYAIWTTQRVLQCIARVCFWHFLGWDPTLSLWPGVVQPIGRSNVEAGAAHLYQRQSLALAPTRNLVAICVSFLATSDCCVLAARLNVWVLRCLYRRVPNILTSCGCWCSNLLPRQGCFLDGLHLPARHPCRHSWSCFLWQIQPERRENHRFLSYHQRS